MAREFLPKVATGNHLLEGDVVYFTAEGGWTRLHSEAALAETPEAADALLAKASVFPHEIVGVYLAEARLGEEGPEPVHFREAFRTRGPSNYFHGKQETWGPAPTQDNTWGPAPTPPGYLNEEEVGA